MTAGAMLGGAWQARWVPERLGVRGKVWQARQVMLMPGTLRRGIARQARRVLAMPGKAWRGTRGRLGTDRLG